MNLINFALVYFRQSEMNLIFQSFLVRISYFFNKCFITFPSRFFDNIVCDTVEQLALRFYLIFAELVHSFISELYLLNHLFPMHPFPTPWKIENLMFFWCFQGVEKVCIWNKWVNTYHADIFSRLTKWSL